MGCFSRKILLTVNDYNITLSRDIKLYQNDAIELCFTILQYETTFTEDDRCIHELIQLVPLKAYMLIESPEGEGYVEATSIRSNEVVFRLSRSHTNFAGIGHLQIVLKDANGCRITLPSFSFEIKESINPYWVDDDEPIIPEEPIEEDFVSEDNNIILNGTEEDNSMKNLVLQNAEGRRFKLIIEEDGSLGAKEVPAPLKVGYEVKFLVDQEVVLDEDGNYIEEFQNLFTDFELKGTTKMSYYDTEELALNEEGWTIRIRKKSNKKAQQCTFKKRYSGINKGEILKQKEVDKALKNAVKDGYNTLNVDFPEAEIDYSFSNATLSFSCDIDIAETGKNNTDIPNSEESIAFIEANKPEIFDLPLEGIREHGAVILTSYSAMMEDVEVAIESMTIKASKDAIDETETIIEVSFKLEDYEGEREDKTDLEIVNELREKLRAKLNEGGYLIERNGLKTNTILERY